MPELIKTKSLPIKITFKSVLSLLFVALAVVLPQLTHAIGGAAAGSAYMPMYLPALLAGIILGPFWGLAVGALSPIASYGFTILAFGEAMPILSRVSYMTGEIAIYGLVTGLFAKKVYAKPLLAFPAVLLAQFSGRAFYLIYNLIAGRDFISLWTGILNGFIGLWLQAIIVPALTILLCKVIKDEQKTNEG